MGATAEQLGVMKLSDALRKAQSLGMDLVEVAPTANPPVCKIVDFGKFRYDIAKQEKEKKSSGTKLKEIKFRVNIDGHDYLTKIRHGEAFLDKGNKVRVQLQFRGREMAHQEIGMQLMYKVRDDLNTMSQGRDGAEGRRTKHHDDALAATGCAPETEVLRSPRMMPTRSRPTRPTTTTRGLISNARPARCAASRSTQPRAGNGSDGALSPFPRLIGAARVCASTPRRR
jgi:translation initiation factor IF-3